MRVYHFFPKLFFTALVIVFFGFHMEKALSEEMARTTIVEATGTGIILHEDDAAKARERAIADSLISAVEKILVGLLPIETRVANFESINNMLFSSTDNIIQGYKVLTEDKYGNFYRVMVQATVSVDKVQQNLSLDGIGLDQKTMPSILFLISEQNLEDIATLYWWGKGMTHIASVTETAISETLQKKGFFVVSHQTTEESYLPEKDQYNNSADLDIQGAIEIGQRYKADVVIFGTSSSTLSSNTIGEDIKSFIGRVSLNAFRTDSGSKIASMDFNAFTVNTDEITGGREALSKAGVKAGEELAPIILSAWQKEEKKPAKIKLKISGTKYLSFFETFRKKLNHISGVQDVQTREIESDKALIIVNYQGSGKELANELILNPFTSFGINIIKITEESLKIDIVPVSKSKPKK